jgi:hypothetical protein
VLEVPYSHPLLWPGARTGVWCATKLATDAGMTRRRSEGPEDPRPWSTSGTGAGRLCVARIVPTSRPVWSER